MSVKKEAVSLKNVASLMPEIAELISNAAVTEIMCVTHPTRGVIVFFEESGELHRAQVTTANRRGLEALARAVGGPLGFDPAAHPMIDGRLADGSRVAIAVPPAAPYGPVVTIRRHSKVKLLGSDLVAKGALPQFVFDGVVDTIKSGGNVLVAGGTGSGKTTLLNAFIAEFDEDDRILVIEDTLELKVDHLNTARLEASGSREGMDATSMVKHALRQRPDHIILGEVRGAEAYDVLQALNTGHGGSLTTIHANTAADALMRLASCARQGAPGMPWDVIAANCSMAFDLVIYQERRHDRSRGVAEVIEVGEYDRNTGKWALTRRWAAPYVLEAEKRRAGRWGDGEQPPPHPPSGGQPAAAQEADGDALQSADPPPLKLASGGVRR